MSTPVSRVSRSEEDSPLLSTTTSFSRFSKFTIWIMEILRDCGSVACWQVAEQTMKSCRYVNVYLNRLRKHGIAAKRDGFWFLTDFGEYLTSLLSRDYRNNRNNRNRHNTNITQEQHKYNTNITLESRRSLKQTSLEVWLKDSDLNEAEKRVVEVLVDHYNKTGSKFLYFHTVYDIAEKFQIKPDQVNEVLMKLKQDHIVYSLKDRAHNAFKIGLYKAFVELLAKS